MIPNKVKIGIYDYNIKETDEVIIVNDHVCTGLIAYEDLIIELKNSMPEQKKYQTLLHEIVHGIIREYSVDLGNDNDETIVDTMAKGLYQVLMDNDLKLK